MAPTIESSYRPGHHSYNGHRFGTSESLPKLTGLNLARWVLLLIGLSCIGYFAYTWADENIYQSYQNWAFDQQKLSNPSISAVPTPAGGSVIGRVVIDRLHISAIVRQGVDSQTLKLAVGHVPTTALPGQDGNFAIAAHRDTLFRGLKDIQVGDIVHFETSNRQFDYEVAATKIVQPHDVSVLHADGGGLVKVEADGAPVKLMTMITCYPFYYLGAAPQRFIVQAKLIDKPSIQRN